MDERVLREEIRKNICNFKPCFMHLFGDLNDNKLFTLKFHVFDLDTEHATSFKDISFLNAFFYEHSNIIVKQFI